MEPWQVELEYEIDQLIENKTKSSLKVCPNCKNTFKGDTCSYCGDSSTTEHYFDPDYGEYEKQVERENAEFFNQKWEDVPDSEDS